MHPPASLEPMAKLLTCHSGYRVVAKCCGMCNTGHARQNRAKQKTAKAGMVRLINCLITIPLRRRGVIIFHSYIPTVAIHCNVDCIPLVSTAERALTLPIAEPCCMNRSTGFMQGTAPHSAPHPFMLVPYTSASHRSRLQFGH